MMWIGNGDERNFMRYLNRTGVSCPSKRPVPTLTHCRHQVPTEVVEPHVLHLVQRYRDLGVVKG